MPIRCLFGIGMCPISTGHPPRCLSAVCVRPMGIVPRRPCLLGTDVSHMGTEASARCLFGMRMCPMSTEHPPRCLFVVCVCPMGIVPRPPCLLGTDVSHMGTEASARCLSVICVCPMSISAAAATIGDRRYADVGRRWRRLLMPRRHEADAAGSTRGQSSHRTIHNLADNTTIKDSGGNESQRSPLLSGLSGYRLLSADCRLISAVPNACGAPVRHPHRTAQASRPRPRRC